VIWLQSLAASRCNPLNFNSQKPKKKRKGFPPPLQSCYFSDDNGTFDEYANAFDGAGVGVGGGGGGVMHSFHLRTVIPPPQR
jgi:hypothetical protein